MTGKNIRRFYIPIFLLYAVCSSALFLVSYLLRSPESETFTRNVLWGELLLFVLWLPIGAFCRPGTGGAGAGVLPFLLILVCGYVAASGGTFAYSLFVADLGVAGAVMQIIFAAVALVVGLGLWIAAAHASEGTDAPAAPREKQQDV